MEIINQPQPSQSLSQEKVVSEPTLPTKKPGASFNYLNLVLLILAAAVIYLLIQNRQLSQQSLINSFEECAALPDSVIMESYPAICTTDSGRQFKQVLEEPEPSNLIFPQGTEPEPGPETQSSDPNTSMIETNNQTSTYKSVRVNSFHSPFSLTYPSNWQILAESNASSNDDGNLNFSLTKPGAKILIQQGPMGAGGCLYPDDKAEEGMFSFYGPYTEIKKGELIWRIAAVRDSSPLVYGVCEYKPETKQFAALTQVGIAFLEMTEDNASIVEEFNQIIKSLKILP